MHNKGNYIASLGNFCKWLASEAESLGVEIYPGIPATEILYNQDGSVKGIATGDMGIGKDGKKKVRQKKTSPRQNYTTTNQSHK